MKALMVVSSSTYFPGTQFTCYKAQRPHDQESAGLNGIVRADTGLTTFDQ
jgi:hypothetical protein